MAHAISALLVGVVLLITTGAQTPAHAQSPASAPAPADTAPGVKPLKLAIAGLVHGHVGGLLRAAQRRADVQIVGVYEPDTAVQRRYAQAFGLAESLFYTDLGAMLDRVKPDAVAAFTNTFDHPVVVETAAARHVPVMMEKPLAVSMAHARRIQQAAQRGNIAIVVNYETSWYPSHGEIWRLVEERKAIGGIRKMVAMDGHEGPKEIGVQPEFLSWLSDPEKNGAGALFDFGCYGANLMTWLMHDQRPLTVTAVTQRNKPDIYPRVDDEATIVVQYPKAQGIIQASWNWPFGRKDFEVYGERGLAVATGGAGLRVRLPLPDQQGSQAPAAPQVTQAGQAGQAAPARQRPPVPEEQTVKPEPLPADEQNSLSYLTAVVRGQRKSTGLSSLENNMIVTEILEAARESARTGKTVTLSHN
jgi:predicted dehydrogenase